MKKPNRLSILGIYIKKKTIPKFKTLLIMVENWFIILKLAFKIKRCFKKSQTIGSATANLFLKSE